VNATQEGFLQPAHGYRTWYRIVGADEAPGRWPLLVLHGGPGGTHDYLEPLEALAAGGRRVVFYDQLGNGRSDQPHDPRLWTVGLFLDELRAVRQALGLRRVHLFGHSWGGMLAMEYACTAPAGLRSLIVADAPGSMPHWLAEARRLRAALPSAVQATLLAHEQAGTTDEPAYQLAALEFYRRHFCRLQPWPACLERSMQHLLDRPQVFHTMNGPTDFHVVGTLRSWSILDRLSEINERPTLLISGQHDEATPAVVGAIQQALPGARWELFSESSHCPHLEEPARFLAVVEAFLASVERPPGAGACESAS